jgi:hypothetical protein
MTLRTILTTALIGKIGVEWAYHYYHIICFFISIVTYDAAADCLISFNIIHIFSVGDKKAIKTHLILVSTSIELCVHDLPICQPRILTVFVYFTLK